MKLTELDGDHCLTSSDIEHAMGMWESKVGRLKEELKNTQRVLLALILLHPDKQLSIPMHTLQKIFEQEKDYMLVWAHDVRRRCYVLGAEAVKE